MIYEEPSLVLTFLGGDLAEGHSSTQTVTGTYIINRSIKPVRQLLNGLRSASNQVKLQISRSCPSTEDIIATSGDISAVLKDDDTVIFTGYVSTDFSWKVTKNGEQVLQIILEDVGTRLFEKPFIDTGKHFFSGTASSALAAICAAAGVTIRTADQNILTQSVSYTAEAGATCRELADQLVYECNHVYYFNAVGQLCLHEISADTEDADVIDSSQLCDKGGQVITLSKKIRSYKGARITYTELGTADNYLVYRNTTGQTSTLTCNLVLAAGEYFDGTEIYTAEEWAAATADTFREPALIGAVNASSESQIVGSGTIVNISNLTPDLEKTTGLTCTFENQGGGYFKLTAHNPTVAEGHFTKMDLKASIVFEKSKGVIRTDTTNVSTGKGLLEEELRWIHDKDNAEKHANLLAQYNRHCGATYTFHANVAIPLGSVVELNDNIYTGLDVFVLVYSREDTENDLITYKACAVSTFDLTEKAYYGVNEPAKQSGAQGPPGEPPQIQYAVSKFYIEPPTNEMQWDGVDMEWDSEVMEWMFAEWTDYVPQLQRGQYIWMRIRQDDSEPWQYSRLTGTMVFEPMFLGALTGATPTETPDGQGLIYGDYWICSETFTESEKTYEEGVPYTFNGESWDVMDISTPGGMTRAINCLGGILESGASVQQSVSSYWGWFKNFTAQFAVIANLFARNVTVGDGTGEAGSGFRFRAQAYDQDGNKLATPVFDVMYGYNTLFKVDPPTGKIYFGEGFWYDPADGSIHSYGDNVVINSTGIISAENAVISGNSVFQGSFDCSVIKTQQSNPTEYSNYQASAYAMGGSYWDYFSGIGLSTSDLIRCSVSGISQIAYMRYTYQNAGGFIVYGLAFYNSSLSAVDLRSYATFNAVHSYNTIIGSPSHPSYSSLVSYFNEGRTVTAYVGGNRLVVSIPSGSSGLSTGMLYSDSNGNVKVVL